MKHLVMVMALAACGGDDGGSVQLQPDAASSVAQATRVNDLTSTQISDECKRLNYMWPQKTVECSGDTVMIGYASQSACVSSLSSVAGAHPDCQATVGDVETCLSTEYALGSQLCDQTDEPVACARLASTDCGGTSN